jgi:hypothetical protein
MEAGRYLLTRRAFLSVAVVGGKTTRGYVQRSKGSSPRTALDR